MTGFRRRLALFWTAAVLSVLMAVGANAVYTASPSRQTIKDYDAAYAVLYDAAAAGEKKADLSSFRLKQEDVLALYGDLIGSAPELFYLDNSIRYFYGSQTFTRNVTAVEFCYTMNAEERETAMAFYEKELTRIVDQVDPSLSEAEKALWVHDYMAASYSYDGNMQNFDAYSLFRDRKGVCQAYALAYVAVLRELGMEAVMVASTETMHAWNLVRVDGKWYHVDLVSDDPTPDVTGQVLHENFLLNDEQIAATSELHRGWQSSLTCTSVWNNGLWEGVRARMLLYGGRWYYINFEESTFSVSDFDGKGRTDLYTFRERWKLKDDPDRYWVGAFTGLSECLGHLFINTPSEILIFDPAEMRISVYLEAEPGERIFGSSIFRSVLEYRIAEEPLDPNAKVKTFEITDDSYGDARSRLPFTDVSKSDSFYSAVRFVYDQGLFQGVSAKRFAPESTLTRAMFVTVLGRLCGIQAEDYGGSCYTDVPAGQWYTPYVSWASEAGIVNGIGGGLFDPMGEITRAQMLKMTAYCGEMLGVGERRDSADLNKFTDKAQIPAWAADSVKYCMQNGLIRATDDGLLRPNDVATRAEAAEIIASFAQLMTLLNGY